MTHARTRRASRIAPLPPTLAGLVLDEAEAGDAIALAIVSASRHRLGEYAAVCARRLGMFEQPYTLVLRAVSCTIRAASSQRRSPGSTRARRPSTQPSSRAMALQALEAGAPGAASH